MAQTADPHGDSETSSDEEIMQLYVSADGAGGNENLWFRVRDGAFTSWTSLTGLRPATDAEIKAGSDVDAYVPPDLLSRHPGVAVAWGRVSSDGTLDTTDSYNVSSTSRTVGDERGNDNYYQGVVYTINLGITMASSDYSVIVTCRGSDNYSNANNIRGVRLHNSNIGVPGAFTTSRFKVAILQLTGDRDGASNSRSAGFNFVVYGRVA